MFESFRKSRWVGFLLMLPIFIFFVISGVSGFMQFREADSGVAKVDGMPITAQELEAAHREKLDQYRQMFGANFDPKMFDTPRMRAATLDTIIADRTLERAVVHEKVEIGNDQLREQIRAIPAFQKDGRFDYDTYKLLLQSRGYTEASFEERMRADLGKQTLVRGLTDSAFLPDSVAQRMYQLSEEQRQVRLQRFAPADFAAKVALAPDAVESYYKAHASDFSTSETLKAEYLVLTPDDIAGQIAISPGDVKTYYEQNQSRFKVPEEVHASHILLTAGKDGSAPDKDAARRKADELLKRLRASPGDLAKLAKEFSKDPGSAEKGGDLGWFGRGMMVKPFEDAAFALKPGETSKVVESDFGFHIIHVAERRGGGIKTFDDAKAGIESDLRREQAQKKFPEAAEQFTNMVYEQSDSLQPAADRFRLKVQTIDALTRRGLPAAQGQPNVFGPALTSALFGAESLAKKRNVAAVEVGANALASGRVVEYRPSALKPLDEVRGAIKAKLELAEATRLARAAGDERLKALRAKPDESGFEAPIEVTRDKPQNLPPPARIAMMQLPADKLPAYAGVDVEGGAYAIAKVVAVQAPEKIDEQRRTTERESWVHAIGTSDNDGLVQTLRARYGAKILKPELVAGSGAAAPVNPE